MAPPEQIERLQALAACLLDGFLLLKERYSLLKPMMFDQPTIDRFGSGASTRGFNALRMSLFLSCVQDLAKLTFDDDKRAPSVLNIATALETDSVRSSLREKYGEWRIADVEDNDPEVIEALREIEAREQQSLISEFESHYQELSSVWREVRHSPEFNLFRTARDRITAHTEVRKGVDRYAPVTISSLGLTWGSVGASIDTLQRLVVPIGYVVRNSSFAWDMLEGQHTKMAEGFWRAEG